MPESTYVTCRFTKCTDAEGALRALCQAGFKRADLDMEVDAERELAASTNAQIDQQKGSGMLPGVIDFLKAETPFDPYSKERTNQESSRVAGQPCHGGYAYEREEAESSEARGATLRVRAQTRNAEARAILLAHRGGCSEGLQRT